MWGRTSGCATCYGAAIPVMNAGVLHYPRVCYIDARRVTSRPSQAVSTLRRQQGIAMIMINDTATQANGDGNSYSNGNGNSNGNEYSNGIHEPSDQSLRPLNSIRCPTVLVKSSHAFSYKEDYKHECLFSQSYMDWQHRH